MYIHRYIYNPHLFIIYRSYGELRMKLPRTSAAKHNIHIYVYVYRYIHIYGDNPTNPDT